MHDPNEVEKLIHNRDLLRDKFNSINNKLLKEGKKPFPNPGTLYNGSGIHQAEHDIVHYNKYLEPYLKEERNIEDNERKQTPINNADKLINIIQDANSPNPIQYLEQEINKLIDKHSFLKRNIEIISRNYSILILQKKE